MDRPEGRLESVQSPGEPAAFLRQTSAAPSSAQTC